MNYCYSGAMLDWEKPKEKEDKALWLKLEHITKYQYHLLSSY